MEVSFLVLVSMGFQGGVADRISSSAQSVGRIRGSWINRNTVFTITEHPVRRCWSAQLHWCMAGLLARGSVRCALLPGNRQWNWTRARRYSRGGGCGWRFLGFRSTSSAFPFHPRMLCIRAGNHAEPLLTGIGPWSRHFVSGAAYAIDPDLHTWSRIPDEARAFTGATEKQIFRVNKWLTDSTG